MYDLYFAPGKEGKIVGIIKLSKTAGIFYYAVLAKASELPEKWASIYTLTHTFVCVYYTLNVKVYKYIFTIRQEIAGTAC